MESIWKGHKLNSNRPWACIGVCRHVQGLEVEGLGVTKLTARDVGLRDLFSKRSGYS